MSIEVNAKNMRLWKNEHEGRKGTFYTYSVSNSKKMKDGTYKNKGIKVIYTKGLPKELPNGAMCDIVGFLTLDVWEGRDGEVANHAIFAQEIKFHDFEEDVDSFEQLDEDVPF